MALSIKSQNKKFGETTANTGGINIVEAIREAAITADESQRDLEDLIDQAGARFARAALAKEELNRNEILAELDAAELNPAAYIAGIRYVFDFTTH